METMFLRSLPTDVMGRQNSQNENAMGEGMLRRMEMVGGGGSV